MEEQQDLSGCSDHRKTPLEKQLTPRRQANYNRKLDNNTVDKRGPYPFTAVCAWPQRSSPLNGWIDAFVQRIIESSCRLDEAFTRD